jgi:hypothetical protein
MHPCEIIYKIGGNGKRYGEEEGVCRITGKQSTGQNFDKWIRDTFTDIAYLKPGTIISNEASFCFEEASEIIQQKTGKEKPQRFRTYSHIVHGGKWFCYTKANKKEIYESIIAGAELVCLTDSGQKHMLFKHRTGMWQLDDMFITPDVELLKLLHTSMCDLMRLGFSQTEILSGQYNSGRIFKCGIDAWVVKENEIKSYRGSQIMEFAGWMLFIDEESKRKIDESYKKKKGVKMETKPKIVATT